MSSRRIQFFDGFTSETTPNSTIANGPDGDVTWEGAWVSGNYTQNQAVEYNGSAYVCHTNTVSNEIPTNTSYWDLLASKGDTGSTGSDGADGQTLLNGTVVPTTEGNDGDFYLRTDTSEIYGPKSGGAWGSGTSIIGDTGATGATGVAGADGDITWEGEWVSGNYTANQAVHYAVDGQSYVCHTNTISNEIPTNTSFWDLMSAKGDAGSNGTDGASAGSDIEAKSSSFTAANHKSYLVDTGTAVTVTLPAASLGLEFWVKDKTGEANTNNITIARAGSESIEGVAANKTLQTDWGSWHFICDGTNWFMING